METRADKIRAYCRDTRIIPARARGEKIVKIRAGDIAEELGLQDRVPSVCGALQALKFETIANVKRIATDGPGNGMNCIMTFELR
ncbi:MAG: hypothetical protein K2N31_03645 [Treponemataceae bacterium]|nr:hypothetical protein [Treponemataceae bacterium]